MNAIQQNYITTENAVLSAMREIDQHMEQYSHLLVDEQDDQAVDQFVALEVAKTIEIGLPELRTKHKEAEENLLQWLKDHVRADAANMGVDMAWLFGEDQPAIIKDCKYTVIPLMLQVAYREKLCKLALSM